MGQAYIDFLERRIDELTAQLATSHTGGTLRGVTEQTISDDELRRSQTDWDDGLYVHEPDFSPDSASKDIGPIVMVIDDEMMNLSMMDVIRRAFESLDYYSDYVVDNGELDVASLIDYANRADQEATLRRNQPKAKSPVSDTTEDMIRRISEEIAAEAARAATIHAPLHSPHEAISVIREEFEELWDHVKADTGLSKDARKEAVQLGAMALRYILNLIDQPQGGILVKPTPSADQPTLQDLLNSVRGRA
jgi:hypothetical protein